MKRTPATATTRPAPALPRPNDRIVLFGMDVTVLYVEPHNDWEWYIECETTNGDTAIVILPSATRTV